MDDEIIGGIKISLMAATDVSSDFSQFLTDPGPSFLALRSKGCQAQIAETIVISCVPESKNQFLNLIADVLAEWPANSETFILVVDQLVENDLKP
ncbi:MAG: hypothetical protein LBT47_12290 [Deltaproteobacteria bacterium]|nr:hypothetical protein [Deltaproteobacteria bacterium]